MAILDGWIFTCKQRIVELTKALERWPDSDKAEERKEELESLKRRLKALEDEQQSS